jgi:hypothetical protein
MIQTISFPSWWLANQLKEDAILGLDWLKQNSVVIVCFN